MHLSILSPTTPLPGKGGGMVGIWIFEKLNSTPVGHEEYPGKLGYSAVEVKLILWTVKSPTSGAIFQVKSDQIPHYSPRYAWEGGSGA